MKLFDQSAKANWKFIAIVTVLSLLAGGVVWLWNNNQAQMTPGESIEGKFCGGIAANLPENKCPPGYKCQLDGSYPDAGGKCVRL